MKPNASKHNPDPQYLRSLIEGAGYSQAYIAERLGLNPRTVRMYLAGDRPISYIVQYAVEELCR